MRLVIAGAGGKMGRALIDAALADPAFAIGAALEVAGSPALGSSVGGVPAGADRLAGRAR